MKYRFTLEQLEELAGKHLESFHIFGGGTKNRLLNQFSANATGRPVIVGPVEATAIENILMQSITLGRIGSLQEARLLVNRSLGIEEYHPIKSEGWEQAYARLRSL